MSAQGLLPLGYWHSGPVKAGGQRQRGLRGPETQVPALRQWREPHAWASYSHVAPV